MKHPTPSADPLDVAALVAGCKAFWKNESRDAIYRIALRQVAQSQESPADLADAISVLLLIWNNAAYRYAAPDFFQVERFLCKEQSCLAAYRSRMVDRYDPHTEAKDVERLFTKALDALAAGDKVSPVGTAKALHLLAPAFFPLWDRKIAEELGFRLQHPSQYANQYVRFMNFMKLNCRRLESEYAASRRRGSGPLVDALSKLAGRKKTLLKFFDEYYYAKYTKHWVA